MQGDQGKNHKKNELSFDELYEDFLHPNPNISNKAAIQMSEIYPDESISRFLMNLGEEDVVSRRKSIRAIGLLGQPGLLKVAELFHATENITIRVSCLKAFVQFSVNMNGELFPAQAMKTIEMALMDESPEIILVVVPLLRQLGEQGLPHLIRISQGKNILRVMAAVTALGEIDDPYARNLLEELLKDEATDPLVRESVKDSLKTHSVKDSSSVSE